MLKIYSANDISDYMIIDEYDNIQTLSYYVQAEKRHYLYSCQLSNDFEENTVMLSLICIDDIEENLKLQTNKAYRTETAFFLEFVKKSIFEQFDCIDAQAVQREKIAQRAFSENNDFYCDEYRQAIKRAKENRVF